MNVEKLAQLGLKHKISYISKDSGHIKNSSERLEANSDFNSDSISISDEAKELLAEHEELMGLRDKSSEFEEMLKELRQASKTKSPYDDLIKCIEIATRIIKGHNVPDQDKIFLAENNPKMFSNAILLRQVNDDPEDYDSLLDDKKNENEESTIDLSHNVSFEGPSESGSEEEG